MLVEAIQTGFYGNTRRRPGDRFRIKGPHELGKWMRALSAPTSDGADGGEPTEPPGDAVEIDPPKRGPGRPRKQPEEF